MAYFSIYQGLRGCYMPDGAYIVKAESRKQSKEYVIPYRFDYHGKGCFPMALGVFSGMARKEYLEQEDW